MKERALYLLSLRRAAWTYLKANGINSTVRAIFLTIFGKALSTHRPIDSLDHLIQGSEVLIISADPGSASHTYRVENAVNALNFADLSTSWISLHDLTRLDAIPASVEALVFHRSNIDISSLECLRAKPRFSRPAIIYDIDDLTFDNEHYSIEKVAGLREIDESQASALVNIVSKAQHEQIQNSDFFFGTTKRICESAEKLAVDTKIIRNVLPNWMLDQAKDLAKEAAKHLPGPLNMVYASGTNTHKADFQVAWEGIRKFLEEDSTSKLTIIGYSPIDRKNIPQSIKRQVFFRKPVTHGDLLKELSLFNLNLAPLELGSAFVEGKSALKFLHAGILGIPTVASQTEPFEAVIEDSFNGWLVKTANDWHRALLDATHPTRRVSVGQNALETAKKIGTINSVSQDYASGIKEAISRASISREGFEQFAETIKKIVWVVPGLPSGSGGHRNILRFASNLGAYGYESKLLVLDEFESNEALEHRAKTHYGSSNIKIVQEPSEISRADIVFTTRPRTIDLIEKWSTRSTRKYYLVQDLEALFYPMSTEYLFSMHTLTKEDYSIVCSGPWISDQIEKITGRKVPHFIFPVDREIYNVSNKNNPSRDGIVFFAKSDTPRRLFELGLDALRKVRNSRPDIKISFFGGDAAQQSILSNEFTILGGLPNLKDLADLYRASRVGLAFSSTNPSLIPFEMMACGLPVVDIKNPADNFNKFGVPPAALLAEPTPAEIAKSILKIYDDKETLSEMTLLGTKLASQMPSEEYVVKQMAKWLNV